MMSPPVLLLPWLTALFFHIFLNRFPFWVYDMAPFLSALKPPQARNTRGHTSSPQYVRHILLLNHIICAESMCNFFTHNRKGALGQDFPNFLGFCSAFKKDSSS